MTLLYFDKVHGLATRALLAGATLKATTRVHWDISGDCERPRVREVWSRPSKDRHHHGHLMAGVVNSVMTVELEVKCRGCVTCLKRRGQMWRCRAEIEYASAAMRGGRTWFGTLTARPQERVMMHYRAATKFEQAGGAEGCPTFEGLPDQEQQHLVGQQLYREFQLYMKRLRKETGALLRYLVVIEHHQDGFPHLHVLLHEYDLMNKVLKEQLDRQWRVGFSKWREAKNAKAGAYATKYLLKEAGVRVRSSGLYGRSFGENVTPKGIAPSEAQGREDLCPSPRVGTQSTVEDATHCSHSGSTHKILRETVPNGGLVHVQVSDSLQIRSRPRAAWLSKPAKESAGSVTPEKGPSPGESAEAYISAKGTREYCAPDPHAGRHTARRPKGRSRLH